MHIKQLSLLHLTGEATVLEYKHNHILDLRIISISVKERGGCKSEFGWVLTGVSASQSRLRGYRYA
jgi:hypothetical protein